MSMSMVPAVPMPGKLINRVVCESARVCMTLSLYVCVLVSVCVCTCGKWQAVCLYSEHFGFWFSKQFEDIAHAAGYTPQPPAQGRLLLALIGGRLCLPGI